MSLITLGINHKTAPLELRERLAFTPQTLPEALHSLKQLENVDEAGILSTCNRTEIYAIAPEGTRPADKALELIDWMANYHHLSAEELRASSVVDANCGTTIAARMARMMATISSSTSVNARRSR